MSEELRPCPFCGEPADDRYNRLAKCSNKSCLMNHWVDDEDFFIDDDWNTRPIEDALQSRIAELEKDLSNKEIEYTDLWDDALALQARIAELEAEIYQLTAHSDIERQDDKSPNDTQTQTIVYGKESEE